MIRFKIPGEPIGKGRPRFKKDGHTYTPRRTKNYETLVRYAFKNTRSLGYSKKIPLKINIKAYFKIADSDSNKRKQEKVIGVIRPTQKPDLDNITKIILDRLNGIAFYDDAQIVEIVSSKYFSTNPRVEVLIDEIE